MLHRADHYSLIALGLVVYLRQRERRRNCAYLVGVDFRGSSEYKWGRLFVVVVVVVVLCCVLLIVSLVLGRGDWVVEF